MNFTTVATYSLPDVRHVRTVVEVLTAVRLYLISAATARRALSGAALVDELLSDIEMLNDLTDLLEAMIPSPAANPSELPITESPGFSHPKETQCANVCPPDRGAHWIH